MSDVFCGVIDEHSFKPRLTKPKVCSSETERLSWWSDGAVRSLSAAVKLSFQAFLFPDSRCWHARFRSRACAGDIGHLKYLRATGETGAGVWGARDDLRRVIVENVFKAWLAEPKAGRLATAWLSRRSNEAGRGLSVREHRFSLQVELSASLRICLTCLSSLPSVCWTHWTTTLPAVYCRSGKRDLACARWILRSHQRALLQATVRKAKGGEECNGDDVEEDSVKFLPA